MSKYNAVILLVCCALELGDTALAQNAATHAPVREYANSEFKFNISLNRDWVIDQAPQQSDGSIRLFVATLIDRGSEKDLKNPALFADAERITDGETDPIQYLSREEKEAGNFPLPVIVEEKTHPHVANGVKYATFTSKLELGGTQHTHNTVYVLIRNGHVLRFHLRYKTQDDRKRLEDAFAKIRYD